MTVRGILTHMPNVKNNASAQETRRRLLEAAGEVFADRGLHNTTIRQITQRAGVSIAAVNYHFKDKLELYAALIRHVVEVHAPRCVPPELPNATAEQRLRHFISHFMQRVLEQEGEPWKRTLLSRELIQPTPSFDCLLDGFMWPMRARLYPLVREVAGARASEKYVTLTVNSIFGQCLYYSQNAEVIRRLDPSLLGSPHSAAVIAKHIADLTLAAIRSNTAARGIKAPRRSSRRSASAGTAH